MKTIYKTIKLTNDNKLIINKKEVMDIDITSDMFKNGVINQLKELLTKYSSDKKRLNYLLDNGFEIETNPYQTKVYNDRVELYISSFKDKINVTIKG